MAATPEELQKALIEKSVDGRIQCVDCFQVAKELGTPLLDVGTACDAAKLKIKGCQIGCFD